ncbi:hypothetical protein PGT21_036302 [Puccinia graminis f. sp. tritici]|uniref:Uncharacterized protein n=1 Tax=Puccinia graminis f. sp. tritici TaxID=56615 RepID=A0A5B0P5C0_PUCGR|nr:hypothetical protein PGT21_036302 [Puccinia graminis f. sp. tritici]KAA1121437.1 hypothetical protein PGTUg99_025823 [Puccinia graminis f. sp. tritici]
MVKSEQLLRPLLEQQQQLQIRDRYRHSDDEAMRHTLDLIFAQNDDNQRQDDGQEVIVLKHASDRGMTS